MVSYTVSLTRVAESGQMLCQQYLDTLGPAVVTTETVLPFVSLEEFSDYRVIVTANITFFEYAVTNEAEFTTLSASK